MFAFPASPSGLRLLRRNDAELQVTPLWGIRFCNALTQSVCADGGWRCVTQPRSCKSVYLLPFGPIGPDQKFAWALLILVRGCGFCTNNKYGKWITQELKWGEKRRTVQIGGSKNNTYNGRKCHLYTSVKGAIGSAGELQALSWSTVGEKVGEGALMLLVQISSLSFAIWLWL